VGTEIGVGWGSETLPIGSHVCCYYSGDGPLRDTLAFLRVGLDRPGEFCVLFADISRHAGLLEWLAVGYAGNVAERISEGKLALIGGAPGLEQLVAQIAARLDGAVDAGHTVIRFLGFIGWGMPGWPSDHDLLEFEARVNEVVTAYPAVIICTYAIPALAGPTLIYGGLQTHPLVAIDHGRIVSNPLAVPPADFIGDLDGRASGGL
jgi:hypothetical protein